MYAFLLGSSRRCLNVNDLNFCYRRIRYFDKYAFQPEETLLIQIYLQIFSFLLLANDDTHCHIQRSTLKPTSENSSLEHYNLDPFGELPQNCLSNTC